MGRTGCRVHILRKRGLPFLAARLRPRTALWGGAVFAAALCWLLGTHVWAIQTEIAPAIDKTAVMQQLSEMGVRIGMPIQEAEHPSDTVENDAAAAEYHVLFA